jgi:sugar O-acyltransferase (sialic acid O-acetyltransferase NeuD family)
MDDFHQFIIWGSGGLAKSLAAIIKVQNGKVIALFDKVDKESVLKNIPIFIGESDFLNWRREQKSVTNLFGQVAIGGVGRGFDRLERLIFLRENGIKTPKIIHPTAHITEGVKMGSSTIVLSLANIDVDVSIGDACLINYNAILGHDSSIGDGVHLAPRSTILGHVKIGDNVFIGAGAIVLPHLNIGSNAVVGAGAVVTRDVPPNSTVVGNPARQISQLNRKGLGS